jgi:hypothetical protein
LITFKRPRRRVVAGVAILAALGLGAVTLPAFSSSILFVGNSYTYGDPAGAPPVVKSYRPDLVTDLNGTGIGGVPALFKAMTMQAGLHYKVSLETIPGAGLDQHYASKHDLIVKPWDIVLLQSYSTLDAARPGNPDQLVKFSGLLADALHAQNSNVDVRLVATWSRADQAYTKQGPWFGQPINQMALDVRKGYNTAKAASPLIHAVIPVGEAWNRAIAAGIADANPFDGIADGKVNLWAPDAYHASVHGYYLEALMIFGHVTGRDPRSLGASDAVAHDLGISTTIASALQRTASEQLAAEKSRP